MVNRRVSIVVPVYNAFDELQKCVDSVLKHTDFSFVNLVFVNDNSPDERIASYLDSLESEHVAVHHNDRNYGFSHNVNHGMLVSDERDVILLNTDTVVTKGWVEKLSRCAYSDPSIGTVTPFSNSATICSLPVFCQDNKLPEGFSIEEYADVVEKCSMHKYPEIPVAVGFCMYIKREVIDAIGLFDEETYQRGYGEENDFCNRAQLAGYRNVLCDDTFIFHSGSASFIAKDKYQLMADHQKILEDRFPLMCREIDTFIPANPLGELQQNVNFWAEIANHRKSILYVLHADFRENAADNIGGTQLHVKDLVENLRYSNNVFVLARDREYLNLTIYVDKKEKFLRYYVGAMKRRPSYHEPQIKEVVERILDIFRIDIVHIHHLLGLSADIFRLAHDRKIPLCVTLHDFFMICPSVTMIDHNDNLCIGKTSPDICRECLFSKKRYPERVPKEIDFVGIWRRVYGEGLLLCDKIFAPSNSAKEIFETYYPKLQGRITVIPHGTDRVEHSCSCSRREQEKGFRVAFVGGMCFEKGSRIAYEMITHKTSHIDWYIIGGIGDRDIQFLNQKNLHKTGWYQRSEIESIINDYGIDLICIPAMCSETFGYVLSEAIESKVPVIAADIGALGERIREYDCGWLVPYGSNGDVYLKVIEEIRKDLSEYKRKKTSIENIHIISVKQMAEKYEEEYERFGRSGKEYQIDSKFVLDGLAWAGTGASNVQMTQRLVSLENELNAIRSTHGYKALEILRRMDLPFKKQFKSILYHVYKFISK